MQGMKVRYQILLTFLVSTAVAPATIAIATWVANIDWPVIPEPRKERRVVLTEEAVEIIIRELMERNP